MDGAPTAQEVQQTTERCRDHSLGAGSQAACITLGKWYIEGTPVQGGPDIPADPTRAARVFSHACQQGFGEACTWLGGLRMGGTGVAQDKQRAGLLLYKGCELRDGYACKTLGDFFATGGLGHPVLPKDPALAFTAFHMGCTTDARPNGEACSRMAEMLLQGDGCDRDQIKAVHFWSRGCQLGDQDSCKHVEAAVRAQAAAVAAQTAAGGQPAASTTRAAKQ